MDIEPVEKGLEEIRSEERVYGCASLLRVMVSEYLTKNRI